MPTIFSDIIKLMYIYLSSWLINPFRRRYKVLQKMTRRCVKLDVDLKRHVMLAAARSIGISPQTIFRSFASTEESNKAKNEGEQFT